jgi:hypothetical protein
MGGLERVCSVVAALALCGAVCFTFIAAYLWAASLGYLTPVGDGQVRGFSAALALILWLAWLAWFFG